MATITHIWMGLAAGKALNGAPMPIMLLDADTVYEQKTSGASADDTTIVCPGDPGGGYHGFVRIEPEDGDVRVSAHGNATSSSVKVRQGKTMEFAITPGAALSIIDP